IKYNISILVSLLLLMLSGCSQERINTPEIGNEGDKEIRLTAYAPSQDPSLKTIFSESEGTLNLTAAFKSDDKVRLYAVQEGVITEIGIVGFSELAEDGSKATIDFDLPTGVDASKPMTLIGYSGANYSRISLSDNKLDVVATPYGPAGQDNFAAPVVFRLENFKVSDTATKNMEVRFEHIGCYEVIHFTNNTDEEILADYVGLTDPSAYGVSRSWAYEYGYNREAGKSLAPYYNLVDGSIELKEGYPKADYVLCPNIAAGSTVSVFNWYIPKKEVPVSETVLNYRDKKLGSNIKSLEQIKSSVVMQPGRAYHAYGVWDGDKLSLTDSKGTPKPLNYIKIKTDIPAGKLIEVKAYVSYGNRQHAFVDLNGNGAKDGSAEDCPDSSYKPKLYIVDQPEISFFGKFETLGLQKQQISSIEISPVAMPYELDLRDNNLSAEALNTLFDQLPDLSDVEASYLVSKKLYIEGNPGTDESNVKVAMKKGWILDVTLIDHDQPSIYLMMSSYAYNKELYIQLDAPESERDNVWLDLNGNAEMDEGEQITTFDMEMFKVEWANGDLLLYGNITKLNIGNNGNLFAMQNINNTTLTYLDASNNGMVAAIMKGFDKLEYLNISGNQLMVDALPFDISHITTLKTINVSGCGLKTLDTSKMNDLVYINVAENKLSKLDMSGKAKLRTIIATGNEIENLEIDSSVINHIEIGGNKFTDTALNHLINALPDRTSSATPGAIWIAQNPGTGKADIKAAMGKNWDVDTKNLKDNNEGDRGDMDGEDW
ncbi:MAG: hypothetical protein Q4E10_04160, partial [Porphyromonas sp.]|nr:hypothetical protein [Porphyromonas sp.]